MNYEKKRKRQNGRQSKNKSSYRVIIDEYWKMEQERISALIKEGKLPELKFDLKNIYYSK